MDNQEHDEKHGAQDELNRQFIQFLDNHWPTLEKAVGVLDGKVTILMWALAAVVGLTSTITVKLLFL